VRTDVRDEWSGDEDGKLDFSGLLGGIFPKFEKFISSAGIAYSLAMQ
jgi:hypothetical protein